MKILSVDDNPENLYLIETIGRLHGHEVTSAINGRRALEALEHQPFDLIISDILMPEMDGFQLCREVRRREQFSSLPFIFYTATYTSIRDEEFALSLGASYFLVKPMEPDRFMETIGKIVAQPAVPVESSHIPDEREYLRAHNERLVEKLGKKVSELQEVRSDLEAQLHEKEREILRRKQAEEDLALSGQKLLRASQDLSQFAYAAAHDLREPLRNVAHILGLLQMDHSGSLNQELSNLIDTGIASLKRMHEMISDLFVFTQIGDSHQPDHTPVDTNLVLNEVLQNLQPALSASRARVVWKELPALAMEKTHLIRLFQNLIGNALKYARRGVPPVITVSAVETASGEIRFTVEDNGIGFDPAYAERIFAIFKRLHGSHEYAGTGVGLAICSRIVGLYGGRIWAESTPEQGSKFHFAVPPNERLPNATFAAAK